MLNEEARWFAYQMQRLADDALFPMLNVGSSSLAFRTRKQPWIDAQIFAPARQRGGRVVHLDMKEAPGVDVVGDLANAACKRQIRTLGVRSVFCSNLLEHVTDREGICQALVSVVDAGGHLLLSCPNRYPRHDDPIDNGFRPSIADLEALLPGTLTVSAANVEGGTYWDSLARSPARLMQALIRACLPMYATDRWLNGVRHLAWLNRRFSATCIVVRKT